MIINMLAKICQYLPERVVNYISNMIINKLLNKYANINVEGYDNLKDVPRPIIFICNHLSNADGLVLNKVLFKEDVTFVAGVKLFHNSYTNLGNFAIKTTPILPNSPDKAGLTKVINLINSGNNILIFPEGTRSRTSSMAQGKKGILLIQKLTNAVIVPLGLCGTETLLSISSDDMSKEEFQHANVNVRIGMPIQLPKKNIDETKKDYEDRVLNLVMVGIASLLPKEYRGVYADLIND